MESSRNIHFIFALFFKILLDTIEASNPIPVLHIFITSICYYTINSIYSEVTTVK